MLPKSKIALVQVARRELRLPEDDYRAELLNFGGVGSATDLDERGFAALMNRFQQLGFISHRAREGFGTLRPGMATPAQIALIRELWRELAVSRSDRALDAWLEKNFKVSALRFLTAGQAHRVVGAMRRWQARVGAAE